MQGTRFFISFWSVSQQTPIIQIKTYSIRVLYSSKIKIAKPHDGHEQIQYTLAGNDNISKNGVL